jgi:hypothetical protein
VPTAGASRRRGERRPRAASGQSPGHRQYADTTAGPRHDRLRAHVSDKHATELIGRDDQDQGPSSHPLRKAARKGDDALLAAVVAGQGDIEISTTVVIPKRRLRISNGVIEEPSFVDGALDYRKKRRRRLRFHTGDSSTDRGEKTRDVSAPRVNKRGQVNFRAKFLTGYTVGDSWEWSRTWKFPSGFFRATASAYYGVGLRVPVRVVAEMTPRKITVRGSRDAVRKYWIPSKITNTGLKIGLKKLYVKGEARAGFLLAGSGTVHVHYESVYANGPLSSQLRGRRDAKKTHDLAFGSSAARFVTTRLPALGRPGSRHFGFILSKPSYTWNLRLTPGVRVDIDIVAGKWIDKRFTAGPLWLESVAVNLGKLSLPHHKGTNKAYRVKLGTKTYIRK